MSFNLSEIMEIAVLVFLSMVKDRPASVTKFDGTWKILPCVLTIIE